MPRWADDCAANVYQNISARDHLQDSFFDPVRAENLFLDRLLDVRARHRLMAILAGPEAGFPDHVGDVAELG